MYSTTGVGVKLYGPDRINREGYTADDRYGIR